MGYAFKIEKDHIDTGREGKLYSTSGCKEIERPHHFRLYDDDGVLYYEGTFGDTTDGEDMFAPLDWATDYAGCTSIHYLSDGEWKQL